MSTYKILYAEDNPHDADLTRAHFELDAPDLALQTVDTGAECLARLRAESFDVLLLDNHLPDRDGIDVLRELITKGPLLPVVMVTGVGHDELVVQALRAGACDYVAKDRDYLDKLPDLLRQLVQQQRQQQRFAQAITPSRRHVLYLEPNPMDRDLTAQHFAEHAPHLKLTILDDPVAALERLTQSNGIDLLLTDLRIPGMSALDLLREIRHRGLSLPAIIITGRGDEDAAVATLRLGASDYLVKRDGYLTQLTYSIDNAINRWQLDQTTRRLQQELEQLNQSLEQKVRERTAELERQDAERRRAELALQASERRFRTLIENSSDGIVVLGADGTIRYLAPSVTAITGYEPNDILGGQAQSFVYPDDQPRVSAWLGELVQSPPALKPLEWRYLHRDGSWRWVEAVGANRLNDPHVQGIVANYRDITERKQHEETLRQNEQRLADQFAELELLYRTAPVGLAQMDRELRFVRINDQLAAMNGKPTAEHIGRTLPEIIPELAPEVIALHRRVLDTGQPLLGIEVHGTTPAEPGVERDWITNYYPLRSATGDVLGVSVVVIEVTESKRSAAALRESEANLATAQAQAKLGSWVMDVASGQRRWSQEMFRLVGRDPALGIPQLGDSLLFVHPDDRATVRAFHERVLREGARDTIEFRSDPARGPARWLIGRAAAESDAAGKIVRLVGTIQDITERKRVEAALRESEERLQLFIAHAPAALAMFDREMRYLAVSRRWLTDYALGDRDLIGRSHYDVFPELPERWKEAHRRGLQGEVLGVDEDFFERLDGTVTWLRWEVRPWQAADGSIGGIVIFTEDISERKRAEAAMRVSESRYRRLVESNVVGVTIADTLGGIREANDAFLQMLGYTRAELAAGQLRWDTITPPEWWLVDEHIGRELARHGVCPPVEKEYFRKDGQRVAIRAAVALLEGSQDTAICLIEDITERKRSEAERERLLHVLESSLNEIYLFAADTLRFEYINQGAMQNLGYTLDELQRLTPLDLKPEFTPASFAALIEPLRRGELAKCVFQTVHRRKDGSLYDVEVHLQLVDQPGTPVFLAVILDITERRRAEQSLRESDERLRMAVSGSNTGLWDWDLLNTVHYSPIWKRQIGYEDHEIGNAYDEWHGRVHPDDLESTLATVQTCLKPPYPDYECEFRFRHKDGTYRWILAKGSLQRDAQGRPVRMLGSHVDITERKRAEERLRASSVRLQTLSRRILTAQEDERRRIARELHDELGQVLTAIHLNLQLVQTSVVSAAGESAAAPLADSLRILNQGIEQVRSMSLDLRPSMLDDFGLAATLRWYLNRFAERTKLQVEFLNRLALSRLPAEIETTCFRVAQEALTNVSRHARASAVQVELESDESGVELTIRDNGVGFDVATARQRAIGGGSLGLLSMSERADLAGGSLQITSTPGAGTLLRLRLPLNTAGAAEQDSYERSWLGIAPRTYVVGKTENRLE